MGVGIFIALDEEAAENGGRNAEGSDDEREETARQLIGNDTESDGGDDGTDIGFKQVSAHACDVADVVTDVISDNGGVTGVVLRDTGFDFTDKVGADVSRFGINTAAHTRKQRDGGSTQRKAGQDIRVSGYHINEACTEETETYNAHAHDSAAGEGDGKSCVHTAILGGCRGADVCPGGNVHSDKACRGGKDGADEEAVGCDPVDAESDEDEQDHDKEDEDPVLRHQEGSCALVDVVRDLNHTVSSCILSGNLLDQEKREQQCQDSEDRSQERECSHNNLPPIFIIMMFLAAWSAVTGQALQP